MFDILEFVMEVILYYAFIFKHIIKLFITRNRYHVYFYFATSYL